MRTTRAALLLVALGLAETAGAQVFINQIFLNPPGGLDGVKEYIELQGTPGMSLDGFAIAVLNGSETKYVDPPGSVPPIPPDFIEIDEYFSLDGLSLGRNGLLVIGSGDVTQYPTLLPDTNFTTWHGLWNGLLDVPGMIQNDGSNTFVLVRQRPGIVEADPTNPLGLIWSKDIEHDAEIQPFATDPFDGLVKDLVGDGRLDTGAPNGVGGTTRDMVGATTPADLSDDLEVVDEVSLEHTRGWEYDVDGRHVDVGGVALPFKERRVHALDDPAGINPDLLSRVDYRTTGDGWVPPMGVTGEMANGNNWPDTATEQWIRGESILGLTGEGTSPFFYLSVAPLTVPEDIMEAPQPYETQVPRWLADGQGTEFDFASATYQIMAGRVNQLAIPFIPGDVDRDGDCDEDDVRKIGEVLGDDDWVFSNAHAGAPEGDDGDPAEQIRPWDVDGTGTDGVDASDLQWTLNFQGSLNGRVKGVTYDGTTPEVNGIALNDPFNVIVSFAMAATAPCGAALSALRINDRVELVVSGELLAGAIATPGEENGIQQFHHQLDFFQPGVIEIESIEPVGTFKTIRASLQQLQGTNGDLGVEGLNGYSLSFTEGHSGPSDLYRVTLRAVGAGTVQVSLGPTAQPKFVATAPKGVKVARSDFGGDPGGISYPPLLSLTVTSNVGGTIDAYGIGCVGSGGFTPSFTGSGCSTPGGAITLDIENGLGGTLGNMFIGLGSLSAALTPSCMLQNLPILPAPVILPLGGVGPGQGALSLPLVVPPAVPTGVSAYLQVLFADNGASDGISSTNPVQVYIGL